MQEYQECILRSIKGFKSLKKETVSLDEIVVLKFQIRSWNLGYSQQLKSFLFDREPWLHTVLGVVLKVT